MKTATAADLRNNFATVSIRLLEEIAELSGLKVLPAPAAYFKQIETK